MRLYPDHFLQRRKERRMETRRYAGIVFFIMAVGMLAAPVAASADKTAEVGRHGSFVAYANGVVTDTSTGLEWIAGPMSIPAKTRPWHG
jgi:putative copper export protein